MLIMGMGLDIGTIRMVSTCLMLIKPVIIPMMKQVIMNVKIQSKG